MYPDVQLLIAGRWRAACDGKSLPVVNPANHAVIGQVAHASISDLDEALAAAQAGFAVWSKTPAFERSALLRRAAQLLRDRAEAIAPVMTQEQGKPLAQALLETMNAADILDWFAEEARRAYGRIVPSRSDKVQQRVDKEPVGPVAAFTPWNFPINQAVRKAGAALAAGCSIILKGPEETPGSCAELFRALNDAGFPAGVVNLVFGDPAEISTYLIAHPAIRKISFTGSTAVGKQLAALAGRHMKRVTMELGGHAPVLVFEDADLDAASKSLAAGKLRNAGQVCISPTRFLVQSPIYETFLDIFVDRLKQTKVGDGLDPDVQMGPLANPRRVDALEGLVADAMQQGARLVLGGERIGNTGDFFQPTVLADVPVTARIMNEEPFGPIAAFARFDRLDDAVAEANRLPVGLAAYVYTRSLATANAAASAIESGMVSINHLGLGLIETPFGGVKESGYGSEGGLEAIEAYLVTKFITTAI